MKNKIILLLLSLLLLASCNLDLYLENPPSGNQSTEIPEKVEAFNKDGKPGYVFATQSYYTDRILIRWEAVTGADYYSIERAEVASASVVPSESEWRTIPESVYGLSYTDSSRQLKAGTYYAYRITAHSDSVQDESQKSEIVYGVKLASVASLDATKGISTESITVTWTQMPGVKYYEIYASDDKDFSDNELAGTRKQLTQSSENSFVYTVADFPDKPAGSTVYFSIRSVGTVDTSSFSPVRSGYSKVVGAPSQVEILSVTKGDSTDGITLAWKKDSADADGVDYVVSRTSRGSSEITIFSTLDGNTAESFTDDNGNEGYRITDTSNVQPNVEYTYSVVASNSYGMSAASTATGYLLSSPYDLKAVPLEDNSGYLLSVTMPVGSSDTTNASSSSWVYVLTSVLESGESVTSELTADELASYSVKFMRNPSSIEYANEVRTISVVTKNGSLTSKAESTSSVSIQGIPDKVASVSVSSNMYTGYLENSNGVYPLELSWTTSGSGYTASSYRIRRNDDPSYYVFDVTASDENVYYDNADMTVGSKYHYTVEAMDALGRSQGESAWSDDGYGAISIATFVYNFQAHILKPWEYPSLHPEYVTGSKKAIWDYIRQSGTGSLGSASANGGSGTISYSAVVEGLGGKVSFSYTQGYSEAPFSFYVASNGGYTMHVSMSGSGTVDKTTMYVGGMYPADVKFDSLSVSSNKFAGKYVIVQHYSNGDRQEECKP